MIATSKIIEIINSYSKQLESSGLMSRAFVTNKQLIGAIKTYAKGVNPDSIIAMFDNTLSCSGEEGIVFTTSAIYFSVVDVPGISVKCAMLRYMDMVNASIVSKKLSDFSSVAQIDIKNLPYEYYRITNRTIKKEPFIAILNEIRELITEGYEFENDRAVSIANVRNYLNERDSYMKNIYSKISNGEKLYDVKSWVTDSVGLTPMHYCIAMNDTRNAYRLVSKTMKKVSDLYLKNQPFGIYNYCMSLVMTGITDEKITLFAELFRYTDEMQALERKRKIAKAKETTKEVAKYLWDSLMETTQNAAIEQENQKADYVYSRIDQQEERVQELRRRVDKDPMLYGEWITAQNKLDRMREKADEMFGCPDDDCDKNSYADEYIDEYEDEETEEFFEEEDDSFYEEDSDYEIAEDDYSSLVTSEAIEQHMTQLIYGHIDDCTISLNELNEAYNNQSKDVDPRFPIIKELISDSSKIGERLNGTTEELSLICIKMKYFWVQKYFLERYPSLKEYEVKGD